MNAKSEDEAAKPSVETHPLKGEGEDVESSLEQANAENQDLEDRYLEALKRLKAEYDNYRRRTESERHLRDSEAVGNFVEKLLPVLEAFEAGMEYDSQALKPVYDLLISALMDDGLVVISPEAGSDFDPNFHEAIGGEGRQIREVVRSGYAWKKSKEKGGGQNGEKLLKPAQVKIGNLEDQEKNRQSKS